MKIKSSTKEYQVMIKNDLQEAKEIALDANSYIVIDKNVYELYKTDLFEEIPQNQIFILESLETNKTIHTALDICEIMTSIPAKRNAHLISFGGGIVQDITGFVANILYRGIRWTFFPTTLLAQCDSCIGGKTSLNYKRYKNLLGTFYPPDQIYICTPFCKTLSQKDFESGLGEVVKFNVMQGEQGIQNMESNIDALLNREDAALQKFIESSLLFKKKFIEEDEFDRGIRIQLNFAHTFGHAIETVTNYAIPHGTAVAMGTIIANRISYNRVWMQPDVMNRIEDVLLKIIHVGTVKLDVHEIIQAVHKDKKQIGNELTAVLMRGADMKLEIVHDVTEQEIEEAVRYLLEKLS